MPAANENGTGYASFTFQVQDNGGTANGGVDLDQSANTITINVTAVNERRLVRTTTVTTNEDTTYTFTAADFGFSDPNDTPGQRAAAVKITTLGDQRDAQAQRRRRWRPAVRVSQPTSTPAS